MKLHLEPLVVRRAYLEHDIFDFFLFYRPPNPADLQAFPQNHELLRLELHQSSVGLKISATRWVVKLHLEPLVACPAYLGHDIFEFFLFYRPPNPADLQAFPQNKEILRLELHKSSVGLKISATRWVVKLHLEPLVAPWAYPEHDIFDFFYSTAPLTPLIYKPSPKTRKYCGLSFINNLCD